MPRKATAPAAPPPVKETPIPAPVETPKKKRSRSAAKNSVNVAPGAVALWIGDSPRPKRWFLGMNAAMEYLSAGNVPPTDKVVCLAELKPVILKYTVSIGGDAPNA